MLLLVLLHLVLGLTHAQASTLIDNSVHPCHDFYQYACGGWMKEPLQPSQTHAKLATSAITRLYTRVLGEIIQERHPILAELWDSCNDLNGITKLGNTPLQKDLNRTRHTHTREDLMRLAGEFARTGTIAILKATVQPDPLDATVNNLAVIGGDLTLPNLKYYLDDNFLQIETEYRAYINDLMWLSGFQHSSKKRKREDRTMADIVIEIEKRLVMYQNQKKNVLTRTSIQDLTKEWPVSIGSFLKGLGIMEKLKPEFEIYTNHDDDLDELERLITSISEDDLKVYIAFTMVHSRVRWLGNDFYQVWFKFFRKKMEGQHATPKRAGFCLDRAIQYLPDIIGQHYYTKTFDDRRKADVEQMTNLIKTVMKEHIIDSKWLDTTTEEAAKIKLNKVIPLVGHPNEPKDHPPALSPLDYPANVYTILSHSFDGQMKKVGQAVNRKEWYASSASVNAFYFAPSNNILLPAGILQPPYFYGDKVHPARNFGAIGTIIGHELTHAFDTGGRQYDGDGNRRDWWSETTALAFVERAKCIKNQYSAFKVIGEHGELGQVKGNYTLNENIADNGGLSLAWDAFRKYTTKETNDVSRAQGEQMFFVAFAQTMCMKARDDAMRRMLLTDIHAPNHWRVNGAVMNNRDFAKVFNCPPNSPMNPIDKCQLW